MPYGLCHGGTMTTPRKHTWSLQWWPMSEEAHNDINTNNINDDTYV